MVCCDCSQVKLKPPLWLVGSLLDVLLLLFYPPPVLLIGQTNCPPALSDQLGSSSPGTPIASLGAGKSVHIKTRTVKKEIWKQHYVIHIFLWCDIPPLHHFPWWSCTSGWALLCLSFPHFQKAPVPQSCGPSPPLMRWRLSLRRAFPPHHPPCYCTHTHTHTHQSIHK